MIEEDDASDDRQFIFLPYLPLPLVRYPFPLRYPEAGREGVTCLFIGSEFIHTCSGERMQSL